ncbi:hypothetical protein B0H34DRAFT_703478 [Crassisporium funariophilum]|nr:hypothetical protein B0H34DRAFT_703478 [Crassisporium funariophilum]
MFVMEQIAGDTFQTIGPSNEASDIPADDARLLIDQEIARLEDAVRALRFRRNTLSPISCLPPELLSRIFSSIENRKFLTKKYRWIQFSQVSSHWRSVALNSPTLWTNIPLACPLRMEEMLRRSKMANLTVKANFNYTQTSIRKLRGIMHRVEEIDMVLPHSLMQKMISDLPQNAPQLHTLCMRLAKDHIGFVIPGNVLSETPRLRRLIVEGGGVDWGSGILSGLTHLKLHHAPIHTRPSTTQILNALQRMPALKYLDYDDSFSDTSSDATSSTISVDLIHLRFLRLSSTESQVSNILQRVTFPSSIQLKLSCKVETTDLSGLFSVLSQKYFGVKASGENCLFIRSLAISSSLHELKFEAWSEGTEGNFTQLRQASPRFELTLTPRPRRLRKKPIARYLKQVCRAMPLDLLAMLRLETHDFIGSQTLGNTLGKLPQVRWMHGTGPATALHILEALSLRRSDYEENLSGYHQVSFPALQNLLLDGLIFGKSDNEVSFNMLQDCLIDRCERQVPLQSLVLEECSFDSDASDVAFIQIDLLREIVVDVTWDGVFGTLESGISDGED